MIIGELVYSSMSDSEYSDESQDVYELWLGNGVDHFELIAPGLVTEIEFSSYVTNNEAYEIMDAIVYSLERAGVSIDDWYVK
jgi:hypothetical protein